MVISVVLKYTRSLSHAILLLQNFTLTSSKHRSMEVKLKIYLATSPSTVAQTDISFMNTKKQFGGKKKLRYHSSFRQPDVFFSLQKCYLSSQHQMPEECPCAKIHLFDMLCHIQK